VNSVFSVLMFVLLTYLLYSVIIDYMREDDK
jgi:hypothetical protein